MEVGLMFYSIGWLKYRQSSITVCLVIASQVRCVGTLMAHWAVEQVARAFLDAGLPQHTVDVVMQEGVTGRLLHETIQTNALDDMGVTNKFHQVKIRVLWDSLGEPTPMTPLETTRAQPTHWTAEEVAQAFLDAGLPQLCVDVVRQEGVTGRLLHEAIQANALGDMGIANKFHQAKIRLLWDAQGEPTLTPRQETRVQPILNGVRSPMTPPAQPHRAPVPVTPPKRRAMLPFHGNGAKLAVVGHGAAQKQKQKKMKRSRVNFDGVDAVTNTYLWPRTSIVAAGGELASAKPDANALKYVAKKLWATHVGADLGRLADPWQSTLSDKWMSTGRCMMHSACRLGGGTRYRFTGGFTSMGYSVAVSQVGVCTGGPVVLRKRKYCNRPPTTRDVRMLVLQTYERHTIKNQLNH